MTDRGERLDTLAINTSHLFYQEMRGPKQGTDRELAVRTTVHGYVADVRLLFKGGEKSRENDHDDLEGIRVWTKEVKEYG